jgi:response regulator NasT
MAILDIRMPVMDGLTAAKHIFDELGIPVVIVSAYSDQNFLKTAADVGIFGYMLKPVTADELRATITVSWSRFLQHKQLRQEVQDLKVALEERKLIERAKGILMDTQNLSEAEAMRRLQKQARDSRRRLAEMAKQIIDAHDQGRASHG